MKFHSGTAITMVKNKKLGGLSPPGFNTYYKATIIKIMWCWYNGEINISNKQ